MIIDPRSFIAPDATAGSLPLATTPAGEIARSDPLHDLIVINSLGALENPNKLRAVNPGDDAPVFDSRVIADARASGVTAINMTIGYVMGDEEPFEQSVRAIGQWDTIIDRHRADLLKVRTTQDIQRAKTEKKIGLIYGFQNAAMMGSRADRVDIFENLGVRVVQLTYNGTNSIGGGSLSADNPGLTPFGREVIERLNATRVIVDLSHSGQQTCLDAARASNQPISITHTGCRALMDLPRNKSDEELRAVASNGGYVGIYFMPFLTKGRNATIDDVIAHIEHAIQVCGEDHVGIGTDGGFTLVDDLELYKVGFAKEIAERRALGISAPGERPDVFPFVMDLLGPDQFRLLSRKLTERGHGTQRIEKILGLNFVRFAREVWNA
jgi:membrane dipeptidase